MLEAASVIRREISHTKDQIAPVVGPLELNENCESLGLLTESEQPGSKCFTQVMR